MDVEKERISLSVKALGDDTFTDAVDGVKRGAIITVTVTAIEEGGVEVEYNGAEVVHPPLGPVARPCRPAPRAFPGRRPHRRARDQHRPEDPQLGLSIKAREIAEEKEAVEQYGSSDSGASLGDILGAALKDRS